ncbi:PIN domain-containing protein [Monaibacterium marinum]|uniref:PIN domain-containing protein n=1 Tax=Pontivivens marinum TaxID=1690039 RepID=A0A2C9CLZ8_9RHOB|nr:PIN domain-containing protein [Monaibacterium marinum]SOH92396.1 PIN domain-containing protein [Monaibacterium marinum]
MRVLLDACVLYPTIQREIFVAVAARGDFVPLWSERILEEWARAALRAGPDVGAQARVEIALLRDRFPNGCVAAPVRDDLDLPDPDDVHVLSAAIEGQADMIVTRNLKDFPNRILARENLYAIGPDPFFLACHAERSLAEPVEEVRARTQAISGREQVVRPLLKRAGLPRLGKALSE